MEKIEKANFSFVFSALFQTKFPDSREILDLKQKNHTIMRYDTFIFLSYASSQY